MVDPDRVRSKLSTLATFRRELGGLAALPTETYLQDHIYEGRYLVQAAAQACIELAHHVIASNGWTPTTGYRDAFLRLAEHGVIDGVLAERLQDLAGLRNRLVHLYDDVDDALVHQALQAGLTEIDAYAAAVAALVNG
jgi:uncharacterized protein YutE (UPF0331/DUF86 family)